MMQLHLLLSLIIPNRITISVMINMIGIGHNLCDRMCQGNLTIWNPETWTFNSGMLRFNIDSLPHWFAKKKTSGKQVTEFAYLCRMDIDILLFWSLWQFDNESFEVLPWRRFALNEKFFFQIYLENQKKKKNHSLQTNCLKAYISSR